MADNSRFDYIIVGGGTAGLVLANRLSEDPNISVAVIEAGANADADPRVATPGMWTGLLGTEHDWGFGTEPQKELNGRRIGQSQGKMMGGSSSINVMAVIPFSAADINAWEKIGNSGWNWETMSPYLKKPFNISLPEEEVSKHLSISWAEELAGNSEGPVPCSFVGVKEDPLGKAWVETFEQLGHRLSDSPFAGKSVGPYNVASTVNPETKTRSSSSIAYYQPAADRPNLQVFTNTVVEKVLLGHGQDSEELRAIGVQTLQDSNISKLYAGKEVILSAGVFNSPKILELSGIGNPDILKPHGIEVRVANPYVGANLQDHLLCGIGFEAAEGVRTGDDLMRKDPEAIQLAMQLYKDHKAGPFASPGVTSVGYLPTVDFANNPGELTSTLKQLAGNTTPDHPLDSARAEILRTLLEEGEEGTAQYCVFPAQLQQPGLDTVKTMVSTPQPGNFISIITSLSHPLSTGSVHISSSDPTVHPTIDHRYLQHPLDLDLHARHTRFIEAIAAAKPLASLLKPNGRRHHPSAFFEGDLEKAKAFARAGSRTNWHSCGTCAKAPREKGGVVDEKLRVYGVKGLRVVDASVFPFVPQSNNQSLVYAVAERAADIIKGGL